MQDNVKVIFNGNKNRVFIQGEPYVARHVETKSCDNCAICNRWGRCKADDPMMGHCIETEGKLKLPVVWRSVELNKPVGDILAEDAMADIDMVVGGFTQEMMDDFIRRMREGLDSLEKHGTCLEYKLPF